MFSGHLFPSISAPADSYFSYHLKIDRRQFIIFACGKSGTLQIYDLRKQIKIAETVALAGTITHMEWSQLFERQMTAEDLVLDQINRNVKMTEQAGDSVSLQTWLKIKTVVQETAIAGSQPQLTQTEQEMSTHRLLAVS